MKHPDDPSAKNNDESFQQEREEVLSSLETKLVDLEAQLQALLKLLGTSTHG